MTKATTVDGPRAAAPAAGGEHARRFGPARHLIHCPVSWDHCLDGPSLGEEHFVIADRLPGAPAPFHGGGAHFHDTRAVTEAVQEVGEFVGHRYFGVPEERPGLFFRFDLRLTDLSAWRTGPQGGSRLATRLRALPAHVVNGVPRGLDFEVEVSIDGTPCAAGSAGLVFLMPGVYGSHLARARRTARAAAAAGTGGAGAAGDTGAEEAPDRPVVPADPGSVGREDPADVVVGHPEPLSSGRWSAWVLTDGARPPAADADGRLTGARVLESLRQTALLAAGRSHGLAASRSTLAASRVHFRGPAEAGLPMRCTALPGRLERDAQGRPSVPVTLTLTQCRRPVAEARAVVVQDF
ncbi:AfsA-related hotdog domain-containing protein [Streptomyces sp. NPDC006326]|uniref:AfsA-related hotdog domain-containing protein n=1 Tax=Streptomyces sp. NPDC006326 TaxID=3156752 RepID=UPI0033A85A3D